MVMATATISIVVQGLTNEELNRALMGYGDEAIQGPIAEAIAKALRAKDIRPYFSVLWTDSDSFDHKLVNGEGNPDDG